MNVSVVIATCGDEAWAELAWSRAFPSANAGRIGDPNVWTTEILVRHYPEMSSIAEARNAAARDASGDWLCFLDADDELAPGYLAAMELAEAQSAVEVSEPVEVRTASGVRPTGHRTLVGWRLLVPAVCYVERDGEYGLAEIPNGGGSRPLIDINHAVIGTLVPRRLFLALDGFRDLEALEDWDLWLRCEEAGAKLVPVPDAVYRAWVRPGSRNSDQSLYHRLRGEALARRAGRP